MDFLGRLINDFPRTITDAFLKSELNYRGLFCGSDGRKQSVIRYSIILGYFVDEMVESKVHSYLGSFLL